MTAQVLTSLPRRRVGHDARVLRARADGGHVDGAGALARTLDVLTRRLGCKHGVIERL